MSGTKTGQSATDAQSVDTTGFPLLPGSGMRPHSGYAQNMRRRPPGSPTLIQRIMERREASQEDDGTVMPDKNLRG